MQEHLIPQDITNYRFHLIGELDLKQFLELAIFAGLGILTYVSNLPAIIKWPIIVLCVGIGLATAFVPIDGQPISHWILTFFKKLNSPTKFYWTKANPLPAYFTFELKPQYVSLVEKDLQINYSPAKKLRAKDYLTTIENSEVTTDPLEVFNNDNMQSVMDNFSQVTVAKDEVVVTKQVVKPNVRTVDSVRQRQIIIPTAENVEAFLNNTSLFTPGKVTTKITEADTAPNLRWPNANTKVGAQNSILQTSKEEIRAASIIANQTTPTPILENTTPATVVPTPGAPAPATIPAAPPPPVPPQTTNTPIIASTPQKDTVPAQQQQQQQQQQPAPAPTPTNQPQVLQSSLSGAPQNISGQVTDNNNQPLGAAIISLYDEYHNLLALKRTDEHGNFSTSQLPVGKYFISVKKDNLVFPALEVSTLTPLAPLEIKPQN